MFDRQTNYSLNELIDHYHGPEPEDAPRCLFVNEMGVIALNDAHPECASAREQLAEILSSGGLDCQYPAFGYGHMLRVVGKAPPKLLEMLDAFESNPATESVSALIKVRSEELTEDLVQYGIVH